MSWLLETKTPYNSLQSRIDISYLHIYINNMQKFKYNFMYIQISYEITDELSPFN